LPFSLLTQTSISIGIGFIFDSLVFSDFFYWSYSVPFEFLLNNSPTFWTFFKDPLSPRATDLSPFTFFRLCRPHYLECVLSFSVSPKTTLSIFYRFFFFFLYYTAYCLGRTGRFPSPLGAMPLRSLPIPFFSLTENGRNYSSQLSPFPPWVYYLKGITSFSCMEFTIPSPSGRPPKRM